MQKCSLQDENSDEYFKKNSIGKLSFNIYIYMYNIYTYIHTLELHCISSVAYLSDYQNSLGICELSVGGESCERGTLRNSGRSLSYCTPGPLKQRPSSLRHSLLHKGH